MNSIIRVCKAIQERSESYASLFTMSGAELLADVSEYPELAGLSAHERKMGIHTWMNRAGLGQFQFVLTLHQGDITLTTNHFRWMPASARDPYYNRGIDPLTNLRACLEDSRVWVQDWELEPALEVLNAKYRQLVDLENQL